MVFFLKECNKPNLEMKQTERVQVFSAVLSTRQSFTTFTLYGLYLSHYRDAHLLVLNIKNANTNPSPGTVKLFPFIASTLLKKQSKIIQHFGVFLNWKLNFKDQISMRVS